MYLGRGAQTAIRGITSLLVDTPLCFVLKIVWVVELVLALDCMRGAFSSGSAPAAGSQDNSAAFALAAAKEGMLVLALNLVAMPVIMVIHGINAECAKLERDRDIMKKQAQQQGEFAKNLISAEKKAAPTETKTEAAPAADENEDKANE